MESVHRIKFDTCEATIRTFPLPPLTAFVTPHPLPALFAPVMLLRIGLNFLKSHEGLSVIFHPFHTVLYLFKWSCGVSECLRPTCVVAQVSCPLSAHTVCHPPIVCFPLGLGQIRPLVVKAFISAGGSHHHKLPNAFHSGCSMRLSHQWCGGVRF